MPPVTIKRLVLWTGLVSCLLSGFAGAQDLTFSVAPALDGVPATTLMFGLRAQALQGIDPFDAPAPPVAPDATYDAYFAMFDAPGFVPNRWLADYRPLDTVSGDLVELWQVEIHSATATGTCTLNLDTVGAPAYPHQLYFFGPNVYYQPVSTPSRITFPVIDATTIYFFELRIDGAVPATATTFGAVKSLYR